MSKNTVRIRSLELDPPLVNGSGVVDVANLDEGWNLPVEAVAKLGAFVTKTVTLDPRSGHPEPWAEVIAPGTMINAVGLANPGIDQALEQWSSLPARLGIPTIVSIAATDPADLARLAGAIDASGWASGIELNLSCPNITGGLVAADPVTTAAAVAAVRAVTNLPIFAKLSPACGDLRRVATAAVASGADALTCCNTMPIWHADLDGAPALSAGYQGGMSGTGLHPIALRVVAEVASVVDVPVVGLGGVDGTAAARRMLAAGASVIGVGTAAVLDPGVIDAAAKVVV